MQKRQGGERGNALLLLAMVLMHHMDHMIWCVIPWDLVPPTPLTLYHALAPVSTASAQGHRRRR